MAIDVMCLKTLPRLLSHRKKRLLFAVSLKIQQIAYYVHKLHALLCRFVLCVI
jgi:hypothetical protein